MILYGPKMANEKSIPYLRYLLIEFQQSYTNTTILRTRIILGFLNNNPPYSTCCCTPTRSIFTSTRLTTLMFLTVPLVIRNIFVNDRLKFFYPPEICGKWIPSAECAKNARAKVSQTLEHIIMSYTVYSK